MSNEEIIVQVGAEGGDVTLYGVRTDDGWLFSLNVYDCSLLLLDEDEGGAATQYRSSPVTSWSDALALLDRNPWATLHPLAVHPEFRKKVWNEVQRRLGRNEDDHRALTKWREICEVDTETAHRDRALNFLQGLRSHLNDVIPSPEAIRTWMKEIAVPGKDVGYENLFVEKYVLRKIPDYLRTGAGLPEADALAAFLTESKSLRRENIASGSPASRNKHLFKKVFGITPKSVVNLWWDEKQKFPMAQSCPDWAFRSPCPYRVVFEAKLFRSGGIDVAKTELVRAIYQCMFYRGQPPVPQTETHPEWNYEFACLLAYDASPGQALVKAWESVRKEVRDGCWDSANIFVMVLPS